MTITVGGQDYYKYDIDCRFWGNSWWDDPCEDIYTLEDGETINDTHI